jgi:hypothetical protein
VDNFLEIKTGKFGDLIIGCGYSVALAIINYLIIFFLKDKMEPLIRTDKYTDP